MRSRAATALAATLGAIEFNAASRPQFWQQERQGMRDLSGVKRGDGAHFDERGVRGVVDNDPIGISATRVDRYGQLRSGVRRVSHFAAPCPGFPAGLTGR